MPTAIHDVPHHFSRAQLIDRALDLASQSAKEPDRHKAAELLRKERDKLR
jgi:hypothetical protein